MPSVTIKITEVGPSCSEHKAGDLVQLDADTEVYPVIYSCGHENLLVGHQTPKWPCMECGAEHKEIIQWLTTQT